LKKREKSKEKMGVHGKTYAGGKRGPGEGGLFFLGPLTSSKRKKEEEEVVAVGKKKERAKT